MYRYKFPTFCIFCFSGESIKSFLHKALYVCTVPPPPPLSHPHYLCLSYPPSTGFLFKDELACPPNGWILFIELIVSVLAHSKDLLRNSDMMLSVVATSEASLSTFFTRPGLIANGLVQFWKGGFCILSRHTLSAKPGKAGGEKVCSLLWFRNMFTYRITCYMHVPYVSCKPLGLVRQ